MVRKKCELYCYCLMTNHVHLEIKTFDISISKIMKRINQIYAQYLNKKYNYIGHLFQYRYHSEIIKDTVQMLTTTWYIHLNPVRANMVNMVNRIEEYEYSSYGMYIGKT
ncbi:transposase [Clostridium sp.]|uniref:transposase n=1 Tax=Clostridium sp. TaxID=1506 RepID=UPI001A62C92A|nr:transposase [Clostridium sp.]MBK5242693.1 transposase [Clostridium sp.]